MDKEKLSSCISEIPSMEMCMKQPQLCLGSIKTCMDKPAFRPQLHDDSRVGVLPSNYLKEIGAYEACTDTCREGYECKWVSAPAEGICIPRKLN